VEQVASILKVNVQTFKRYYLDFEEHGKTFKRENDGKLTFTQDDIELFQDFMELKRQPGMTKKKAIKELVTTVTTTVTGKATNESVPVETVITMFKQLQQENKSLADKMDKQFMQNIRLIQEVNELKQLQQARIETAATLPRRKSLWKWLFGKWTNNKI
jgi:DNA-binding transcriptional regulator YhcF (GntR family)